MRRDKPTELPKTLVAGVPLSHKRRGKKNDLLSQHEPHVPRPLRSDLLCSSPPRFALLKSRWGSSCGSRQTGHALSVLLGSAQTSQGLFPVRRVTSCPSPFPQYTRWHHSMERTSSSRAICLLHQRLAQSRIVVQHSRCQQQPGYDIPKTSRLARLSSTPVATLSSTLTTQQCPRCESVSTPVAVQSHPSRESEY